MMAKTYPPGTDLTTCPKCRGYGVIVTKIHINDGVCAMCEGSKLVSWEEREAFYAGRDSAKDRQRWLRLRDSGLSDLYREDPRLQERKSRAEYVATRKGLLVSDNITEDALVRAVEDAIEMYRNDPRGKTRDYDYLTYLPLAKQDGLLNWLLGRPTPEEELMQGEGGLF
ncbi:MAG: hypothetical protein J0M07_03795 [Anaerolineae bacterium]|jgi:hypothetical protein|nr:hypothetical protein [Anaerolineae bacterium]